MNKEKAVELWENYLQRKCSEEEKAILESWLLDKMKASDNIPTIEELANAAVNIREGAAIPAIKKIPVYRLPVWKAAVAVLLFAGASFAIYSYFQADHPTKQEVAEQIKPGGNKAILTLDDGSSMVLADQPVGQLKTEAGVHLDKLNDGILKYRETNTGVKTMRYHTLTTPPGGQYQLVLPDGSRVWLNAGSSIRYPTAFEEKNREVRVTGEAYFEVAKSTNAAGTVPANKPFIVHTANQDICVLGTSFNVMAYKDEHAIKTTLIEGRVRIDVLLPSGKAVSQEIAPGQQLIQREGEFQVKEIATDHAIAWKNGYFAFENADVNDVLRQLARWYNIRVENQIQLSGFEFSGEIPRSSSLDELLKMLKIGGLNAVLKGNTLMVTGKNQ